MCMPDAVAIWTQWQTLDRTADKRSFSLNSKLHKYLKYLSLPALYSWWENISKRVLRNHEREEKPSGKKKNYLDHLSLHVSFQRIQLAKGQKALLLLNVQFAWFVLKTKVWIFFFQNIGKENDCPNSKGCFARWAVHPMHKKAYSDSLELPWVSPPNRWSVTWPKQHSWAWG